ncbi:MAG: pilin [bacterium]|nr:pilin [bacterium]
MLCGALIFALASPAHAQFAIPPKPKGLPEGELPSLIAQIVKISLLLVGVVALGFVVYGGFRYITSRGDEREVEEAKNTITYAVVGIIVIGLAYAIIDFVFRAFGGSGGSGGGTI